MVDVTKRLATDESLLLLVDAVKNTETVQKAKVEIQEETTKQINNIQNKVNEVIPNIDQLAKNTSAIENIKSDISTLQANKANASDLTVHTADTQNPHSVTKVQVGLENVDNTSDVDKPISTAQQAEFDKINDSLDGIADEVSKKIESEVATDFSQVNTPEFQQTIDDIAGSVNELKGDLDDKIRSCDNLFDRLNVIENYYYVGDASTPTLSTQNNDFCCYLAELPKGGTNYIVNYKDLNCDLFDKDMRFIRNAYITANSPFSVPSNAKYITVSVRKVHVKDFMLVEGDTLPTEYVEFGSYLKNGLYEKKAKEYHVGIRHKNEDYYEYENLTSLLKRLEGDDTEKIIYIHAGTYDIFQEYGGTTFINSLTGNETWSEVSVFVPNNTKIIGVGRVTLLFKPSAEQIGSEQIAHLFSALNVSENVHIENITIEAMNCRYCVHDEINENSNGTKHIYKNVRMRKIQDTYGDVQAFGCGFTDNMTYEFENCEFTSWSIPFSMHNNDTTTARKGATINIKNCYFQSDISSVSISFRNSSRIQCEHIVNIYDSFVGGQWANLELTASGNTENVNCFNVTMIGCNEVRTQVNVTPENIYPIKQYNSITSATSEKQKNANILSMFSKIICCGDSLTYGLVYTSASTYRQAKVPYNDALQKITNVTTERIATAGYTSKDWWDNYNSRLNSDALYIIFLGTNGGLTDTISTDCIGTDPSSFSDTNTGCYGKILQTLKNNNKTAVLIKPPASNSTTKDVIEQFSIRFSFPTITLDDMESNYYHYAPHDSSYSNSIHYNDLGYVHLANCINTAINSFSEVSLFAISPY